MRAPGSGASTVTGVNTDDRRAGTRPGVLDAPGGLTVEIPTGPEGLRIAAQLRPAPSRRALAALTGVPPAAGHDWSPDVAAEAARLLAKPGGFNESRLVPTVWTRSGDRIRMDLWESDYAYSQTARRKWADLPAAERAGLLAYRPGRSAPLYACGLGLTLTVLTADGQAVITQRAAGLAHGATGAWLASATEGLVTGDAPGGALDVAAAARRAAVEELGLPGDVPVRCEGLCLDAATNHAGVLVTVDLAAAGVTFADVLAARASAVDAWESSAAEPVEVSVASVRAVFGDGRRWMPVGRLSVALSVASALGVPVTDLLEGSASATAA